MKLKTGKNFKYLYGPVASWRLGRSLGIDPISDRKKICTFNCLYCQVKKPSLLKDIREIYAPTEEVLDEIRSLPPLQVDYVTFSGGGEPTLAKNLGELIRSVKDLRKDKVAVLTNSSLLHRDEVLEDLLRADLVVAKLDASSQESLDRINKPMKSIRFDALFDGIKNFRRVYKGKFALQIMFLPENKDDATGLARLAESLSPDEVQVNTPLRPCGAKPLSRQEIAQITGCFDRFATKSVYWARRPHVRPLSSVQTLRRRGKPL